jgi:hypothetical protein
VRLTILLLLFAMCCLYGVVACAQSVETAPVDDPEFDLHDALSAEQWANVDQSVERALAWLAAQQGRNGSFPSRAPGQPAVTSLCVMAFLASGHQPGLGPYGDKLNRAIDYTLTTQKPTGLFSAATPERGHAHQGASHAATYNHAIAGLMLTEAFGQVSGERAVKIERAVNLALRETARQQLEPSKSAAVDQGGWRYLYKPGSRTPSDSDLSVTGWQLMFLRSAKNAQFDVDDKMVAASVAYVERCFDAQLGGFTYGRQGQDRYVNRGMMGVGVLSLALGGKHKTEMARRAGDWLLQRPFSRYGQVTDGHDRFHYSAYYCSHAMAQLGGKHWESIFPQLASTLISGQSRNGSWSSESGEDGQYGPAYPTALSVLALTPAYQLLPVYQR